VLGGIVGGGGEVVVDAVVISDTGRIVVVGGTVVVVGTEVGSVIVVDGIGGRLVSVLMGRLVVRLVVGRRSPVKLRVAVLLGSRVGNLPHGVLARAGGFPTETASQISVSLDGGHGVRAVLADVRVSSDNEVAELALVELSPVGVRFHLGLGGQDLKEGLAGLTIAVNLLLAVVDTGETASSDLIELEEVEGGVVLVGTDLVVPEVVVAVVPAGVVGVGGLVSGSNNALTGAAPTAIVLEARGSVRLVDLVVIAEDTVTVAIGGVTGVGVPGSPLKDTDTPVGSVNSVGGGEVVGGTVADAVVPSGGSTGLPGVSSVNKVVLVQGGSQTEDLNVAQVLSGEADHGLPVGTKRGLDDGGSVLTREGHVSHGGLNMSGGSLHTEEETVGVSHARRLFFVDSQRELQRLASLRVTSGVTLVDFGFPGDLDILGDGAQVPLGSSFGVSAKKNKSKEED
jgi:hypothetical protein